MKKAYLDALCGCKLFQNTESMVVSDIAEKYGTISSCEKNEVIFSFNKYTRSIVIVLKGKASVTKPVGNSRILMSILQKSDIFGMASMFFEEENFLTEITAEEKVTMMSVSKDNLKKIFIEYPVIAENYITILSERIHFLNGKINTYTKPETTGKVASFILRYADEKNEISTLPYSITKVAEALNTGRASVYRSFDTLEQNGIISRNGKTITILDYDALSNQ